MELRTIDTALRGWVVAALVLGLVTVLLGNAALTTVGVVSIILSAVGFLGVAKNFVERHGA